MQSHSSTSRISWASSATYLIGATNTLYNTPIGKNRIISRKQLQPQWLEPPQHYSSSQPQHTAQQPGSVVRSTAI